MAEKKFKCTNFDVCPNQDKTILESETKFEGGEYYCTCGERSKLEEIKEKYNVKSIAIPAAIVIILALLIWGGVTIFSGDKPTDDITSVENEEFNNTTEPAPEIPERNTENNEFIADELVKIGDNDNYSLVQRDQLIEPTLTKYFSDPAFVKRVGSNGTIVETLTAKEYLSRLAGVISLDRVEIIKTLPDESNGKIRELVVQEHYATSIN